LKILVCGGCGFIGSHFANFLKKKGHYVRVADNRPRGECYLPLLADEVWNYDLRGPTIASIAVTEMDWVFQFASNMGGMGYLSYTNAPIMRDNALINLNVLEAAKQEGIKRILFSSSACIYSHLLETKPNVVPLKESDALPAWPELSYGWEKLFSEFLYRSYAKDYGMSVRIARLHNVYGTHSEFKNGREKAPAALCRKVAEAESGDAITVWGDGKQTRSFLYVDDCVEGLWRLMNSKYDKPLNIGSNELTTINNLAKLAIAASGKKLRIKHDLTKPQGVRGRNADLTLMKKMLRWQPETTLAEGVPKLYEWVEQQVVKAVA